MNARRAVLVLTCAVLPLGWAHAAPGSVVTRWADKECPPASDTKGGDGAKSARAECLWEAALSAEQRLLKALQPPYDGLHSQWSSLQDAQDYWAPAVCSLKHQIPSLDWTGGTVSPSLESGQLEQQCTEWLWGWRGQFADAQARGDAKALAAGLAALKAQGRPEAAPAPKHVAIACELARRAMDRPPGPQAPGSKVMTQPDWQELTTLLAISFEDTHSIAELQCAVMARGDVTPPKNCQERLAAALSGQLTPIIRALEKAARTADPPLPGAQPDSAAPSTWESVFPCEWHVKEEVVGGVVGGVLGGVLGGQVGSTGSGPDVLPFGAGMTRPEKISGPVPQYTPEAIAAGVQGLVIAKCVITAEGKVERCRMIKPLPHMEQAVLEALYASRYKPVTLHGEPVVVDYTFNIKLSLPTRGGER